MAITVYERLCLDRVFILLHNANVTALHFQQFQQSRQKTSRLLRIYACVRTALLFLFVVGSGLPVGAQTSSTPVHRVVVLLVPGLRPDDLTRLPLPGLAMLRAEGAAGWMICRAARAINPRQQTPDGRDTSESLALTLASGTRALAQYPSANHQSPITNHQLSIGSLIHAHDWLTSVYGNANADVSQPEGLLLAMDAAGRVDVEQTQALTDVAAEDRPYGTRDDVDLLLRSLAALSQREALQVLVFGDLARADSYGSFCLPVQRTTYRLTALRSLDSLLTALRARMQTMSGPPIQFLLLSPAPAGSTDARDRLAPILMWGRDTPPGTLTSPSTRLPGVVVNTDLLPTLAQSFGLPPPAGSVGRAFRVQPTSDTNTLSSWQATHDRILQSERLKDVYGGLPTLQMLLVFAALGLYIRNQRRFACACCTAVVALPFALLILPSLPLIPTSVFGAGILLAAVVLAFAAIAWRLYPSRHSVSLLLTALFAVLLGTIALDLLSGSPLLRNAWMSYSIMEAARFYGIGNEYMGVVIGAACILAGRKEEKEKRRKGEEEKEPRNTRNKRKETNLQYMRLTSFSAFSGCLLSFFRLFRVFRGSTLLFSFSPFLLFFLAYNRFGAKVGAVPSAGIALGVEFLMLWRGRLRGRDIVAIGGMVALGLGGLLLLDMRHGAGEQSHFARAFAGSGGGIFAAASRKLLLEGHLLLHSPWSAALLVASIGFAYIIEKRSKENREWKASRSDEPSTINPQLSTIYGLVAGAIASLLCNDSGVTAAAMIMLFGFAWAMTQAATGERLSQTERPPVAAELEISAYEPTS